MRRILPRNFLAMALLVVSSPSFVSLVNGQETKTVDPPVDPPVATVQGAKEDKLLWKALLPASGLEGWERTNFGGEGSVEVRDGVLELGLGDPLTGITRLGKDFPKENYEMQWSAQRVEGSDFFAGVTFPIGTEYASLIAGGWGGGLVGLSSINGNDASENETAHYIQFKNGQWYRLKVRVDPTHVWIWIDDQQLLKVARENRKFSVRAEVMRSRPLGYCVFQSKVQVKEWEYRVLD